MQTDKATIEVLDRRPAIHYKKCNLELPELNSYASGIRLIYAEKL
jgi:hypothetical protein